MINYLRKRRQQKRLDDLMFAQLEEKVPYRFIDGVTRNLKKARK